MMVLVGFFPPIFPQNRIIFIINEKPIFQKVCQALYLQQAGGLPLPLGTQGKIHTRGHNQALSLGLESSENTTSSLHDCRV